MKEKALDLAADIIVRVLFVSPLVLILVAFAAIVWSVS